MINRSKQRWQVNEIVKVGFVRDLIVLACIPTPGDYAPDAYALKSMSTGRFYQFVPHNGLTRCANLAEAMKP